MPPRLSARDRKKWGHQLGRQTADRLAVETTLEERVGPAREIERDLRPGLVHGQQEPVARDAALGAEGLAQGLAECERRVLDGVVLVDFRVAGAPELERKPP